MTGEADTKSIDAYVVAIEYAVQTHDLVVAGSHLMDFANDWSPKRRAEAIVLRGSIAEYEEAKRFNRPPRRSFEDIAYSVLSLAQAIRADCLAPALSNASKVLTASVLAGLPTTASRGEDELDRSRRQYWANRRRLEAESGNETTTFRSKDLVYRRDKFTLDVPSLELDIAEILGVVGFNGSGKSTLLRLIAGQFPDQSQSLEYPLLSKGRPNWLAIRTKVEYLSSNRHYYKGAVRSLLELAAALGPHKGNSGDLLDFLISRYGLTDFQSHLYSALSSGFQLRFELVRALLSRPKILILDEPLANLDVQTQSTFLADLLSIARAVNDPTSVIISSHHITELDAVADKMLVLDNGRAAFAGPVDEIPKIAGGAFFELGVTNSRAELEAALRTAGKFRMKRSGFRYLVRNELQTNGSEFVGSLIKAGIDVRSFVDFTRSARQFMEPF